MDANGVEKAILMTKASATSEDRAVRFAEAAPDRFALAVGRFNLLRPMKTVRSLASFVKDHPVAYTALGQSVWGDRMYPATDAVYYPLYPTSFQPAPPRSTPTRLPPPPTPQ